MRGQAVLIVLLVVAVALGFGLSIISQSITDVRISQHQDEAARAFNAAEAGIEEGLKNLSLGSASIVVDDIQVNYSVSGNEVLEVVLAENETAQVILGGKANTLTVEWVDSANPNENPGNCSGVSASSGQTAASLLLTVIDNNNNLSRSGINACSLADDNGLEDVGAAGSNGYLRSYSLAVSAADQLLRLRPIYNRVKLRVSGAETLPTQMYLVSSTAQAPTQESKAIEVTRTEPAAPTVFDYVLFSGTNLVK